MIETLVQAIRSGRRVRSAFCESGQVYFDRLLPFFAFFRESARKPDPAVRRLVASQSAYVIAPRTQRTAGETYQAASELVELLTTMLAEQFGAALVLEIWTDPRLASTAPRIPSQSYQVAIHAPKDFLTDAICVRFEEDLSRIRVAGERLDVTVRGGRVGPRGLSSVVGTNSKRVIRMGLSLGPWFRDSPEEAPLVFRKSRAGVARAIQRLFFRFVASRTRLRPPHFQALGPRAFGPPTLTADRALAGISRSFDVVTSLTPINADESWQAFRASRFENAPRFLYRPVAVDPDRIKREVWSVPIDRVEDPSMEELFRAKQRELDIQASLLLERGTRGVRHNSQRLYGEVSNALVEQARAILSARTRSLRHDATPDAAAPRRRSDERSRSRRNLGAAEFGARVRAELERFRVDLGPERLASTGIEPSVEVRRGISGIVTVHGTLLIGPSFRVSEHRADALLQHEVGTHVLTVLNGMLQPLALFGAGLAGYEPFQEGLALLAELFADGLDRKRLRLIAARVLAARSVVDGAEFIDTFRLLRAEAKIRPRRAFLVAMRVHRGGGFIKDHIYLDGLEQIFRYVRNGGDLELLWTGKVALAHVQLLEELRYRQILVPPVVRPSYEPRAEILRHCNSVADLAMECHRMTSRYHDHMGEEGRE